MAQDLAGSCISHAEAREVLSDGKSGEWAATCPARNGERSNDPSRTVSNRTSLRDMHNRLTFDN
jgi:hypothetical protein